jgi:hypothetical protein
MTDRPSFRDVPTLLLGRRCSSHDITWPTVPSWIRDKGIYPGIDMNPTFQRGRVWTEEQKIRYVEFRLMGGNSGMDIHWNDPSTDTLRRHPILLMDGKQRLDAALAFLNDELPVFGHRLSEYEDRPNDLWFKFHEHHFQDPDEILQWYVDMNRGGVVHSDAEVARVRGLIGTGQTLLSSPTERLKELSRYGNTRLDRLGTWFAGGHLCGLEGAREEDLSRSMMTRWAPCEACETIYKAEHPPKEVKLPPPRKPRGRGTRR